MRIRCVRGLGANWCGLWGIYSGGGGGVISFWSLSARPSHGGSFSEKVGGAKWLIDWMFCCAKV